VNNNSLRKMLAIMMAVAMVATMFAGVAMAAEETASAPEGTASLPSDFEDGTRQGWIWAEDTGVDSALTLQEANASDALSFALAYPAEKPSDAWASAPRLAMFQEGLARGDNDTVELDFYLDVEAGTTGAMDVNLIFQPDGGWKQVGANQVKFYELDDVEQTDDGLYHFSMTYDISAIPDVEDDTDLRNILLVLSDVDSDFSGRVFIDNVRFTSTGDAEEDESAYDPEQSEADRPALLDNDRVRKPSEAGELQVTEIDGQMTLADEAGNKIQLRGMSTHGLQWFPEIVNDDAFAALSNDWESNVVRLAMYVGENGYATNPDLKDLVKDGIEYAFAHDMYVIVDWHVHAPGDPNEPVYAGAYDFFEELADAYQDHPKFHSIIWELANEPSPNNNGGKGLTNDAAGWQAIKSYAEPIVDMLRDRGDNIIIVGSPNWSQRPDLAADDPIDSNNIVYTTHFYSGTHGASEESYPTDTPNEDRGNVMSNARYALENGVAIFVSEWGTSEANGNNGPYLAEADVWLEFLNENNISWVNWSLTNKNETSGAFVPFEMGKSEATDLNPGEDQLWASEELSLSGEYMRARMKGIPYRPIDRHAFSEVIWSFDEGTTQGFGLNSDSPVTDLTLENENGALKISGMGASNAMGDGDFWSNARISSDGYDPEASILGAQQMTIDVIVEEPTAVGIAAIPQNQGSWVNPLKQTIATADQFELQEDGTYKAVLTITADDSPAIQAVGENADGHILNNVILFVGAEDADVIWLDNITFSGSRIELPVVHADLGEAVLPSDFEDGTRQNWVWHGESGVKTALTIEEAGGSQALSWEFAYPEVKPDDGWASAPRLDFWKEGMTRGDNSHVQFDLYLNPVRATEGAISIHLVFQPEDAGYWAQATDTFSIKLAELEQAEATEAGLYHYPVAFDLHSIGSITDDMDLRNMILIFADEQSDFAGKLYIDNVRMTTEGAQSDEPSQDHVTGFVDVSADYWAADVIKRMAELNIVAGIRADEFAPKQHVTRAEFAALVVRALGLTASEQAPFADVDASKWYAEAVAAAYEAGIVSGRSADAFAPNATITREEMAVIIVKAYAHKSGEALGASAAAGFADSEAISTWAQAAVDNAVELGLLQGRGDNLFVPQGVANRAESVQVIAQLLSEE